MTDSKRTIEQTVEAGLGPDVVAGQYKCVTGEQISPGQFVARVCNRRHGRWGRR